MINDVHTTTGKNIADVLHDFKNEFITLASTRLQMLQEEMRLKLSAIKAALPMLIIGLVFLLTAWFVITGALIAIIAVPLSLEMPGSPWIYPIAFGIVAVLYLIFGGMLTLMGKSAMSKQGLKPEKTIRVLQEDKIFLQTEASRIQA